MRVGRQTCHKVKKAHVDPAFAVLTAGGQLASEGKLQLTWGNSKLNTDTSEDGNLPFRTPYPSLPGRSLAPAEACRAGFLPEDGTAILKDGWKIAVTELCVKLGRENSGMGAVMVALWVRAQRTPFPTDSPKPRFPLDLFYNLFLHFSLAFGPRECPNIASLV